MNLDEFAFFNQQLAAMLRNGIPLESALGQLCASMRRGELRDELEKLRADLANGVPFQQALAARKLPTFYVQMLQIGVKSNDLPGTLTLVADYYQRRSLIEMRLKGLMVYPLIVLVSSLALSLCVTIFVIRFIRIFGEDLLNVGATLRQLPAATVVLWTPPILLGVALIAVITVCATPVLRERLRWQIPAFREASLARVAAALAIMLRGGCSFTDAVALVRQMEKYSSACDELALWQARITNGESSFAQIAGGGRAFPALFVWLVANAREDLAQGFQRASEIYQTRATYRIEMMLYAALPVAVLVLGGLICSQIYSLGLIINRIVSMLGS
jgi:type II secretory pathway component PulF